MPDYSDIWDSIETAPKDGTWFWGLQGILAQRTQWGKTSHIPLYGWCFICDEGDEDPDFDLWQPTHWQPLEPYDRYAKVKARAALAGEGGETERG